MWPSFVVNHSIIRIGALLLKGAGWTWLTGLLAKYQEKSGGILRSDQYNIMKNRIFLVRYKRNSSPPQAIAYSDDGIEAVRDFFERAGDATHGTDWFIGFTEHGDFRARLPCQR